MNIKASVCASEPDLAQARDSSFGIRDCVVQLAAGEVGPGAAREHGPRLIALRRVREGEEVTRGGDHAVEVAVVLALVDAFTLVPGDAGCDAEPLDESSGLGQPRVALVEAAESPEDVAEIVERRAELEDDSRALTARDGALEILDAGRVAGVDASHPDRVQGMHRQMVVAGLVGEGEGLAGELYSGSELAVRQDDVARVPGNGSRRSRGERHRPRELHCPLTGRLRLGAVAVVEAVERQEVVGLGRVRRVAEGEESFGSLLEERRDVDLDEVTSRVGGEELERRPLVRPRAPSARAPPARARTRLRLR